MAVSIALQRSECEINGKLDKSVAVQKCGDPPYEIALRFAGCCLRCGACFAAGYSWSDKFQNSRRVKSDIPIKTLISDLNVIPIDKRRPYNWMRILGGEPLLNDEYIDYLFSFILKVAKSDTSFFRNGIVIQTNGIHVGKGKTSLLASRLQDLWDLNPKLMVAIETSIKGTNSDEFELLSRGDRNLFKHNLNSYYELKEIRARNLRPVIIAGFGISESYLLTEGMGAKSLMTILFDKKTPTYHPSIWSREFMDLYRDFVKDYRDHDNMFERMPMYGIKDQFQYGWVHSAIKQGKAIYGDKWYDSKYSKRPNPEVERKFQDILGKFFLRSNQQYYSALIRSR